MLVSVSASLGRTAGRVDAVESVLESTNPYVVGFRLGRNAVDRAQLATLDDMLRVNMTILGGIVQDIRAEAWRMPGVPNSAHAKLDRRCFVVNHRDGRFCGYNMSIYRVMSLIMNSLADVDWNERKDSVTTHDRLRAL